MSKTGVVVVIVVVLAFAFGGGLYWINQHHPFSYLSVSPAEIFPVATSSNALGAVAGASTTAQSFAGSAYIPFSHLISGGFLDASTTDAFAGFFTMQTSTNADGSMEITLHALTRAYQTQSYAVQAGGWLYFLEGGSGNSLSADSIILVDPRGVIVEIVPLVAESEGKG